MRITVVGAGLAGMTTAFVLAERGHAVTVVDRATGPAEGASHANGGMLHASQAFPWNTPGIARDALSMLLRRDTALKVRPAAIAHTPGWFVRFLGNSRRAAFARHAEANARLARLSLAETDRIAACARLSYDRAGSGTLKVFRQARQFDDARRAVATFGALGVRAEAVDASACLKRAPALTPVGAEIVGGLWFPDDISGDARKFCLGLAAHLGTRGVAFAFGHTVRDFERDARGRVVAVHTDADTLSTDAVVLCAGAESPALGSRLGLAVDLAPVKGYSLTLPLPGEAAARSVPFIDESTHVAVCPLGTRLRVAGTAELAGHDTRLDPQRLEQIARYVARLFPQLDVDAIVTEAPWTGLRPMTPSGVPVIDRSAVDNVFLNTGHGHLGWTLAAGSAALVGALVDDDERPIDPAPFAYRRRA